MDAGAVLFIHLVKLVNETDTAVCQDQRTALQCRFFREWVLVDTGGHTNRTRTLPGRVHSPGSRLFGILQKLRLGRLGIAQQQDVDVTSDVVLIVRILGHTTKQRHGQRRFGHFVTINTRSD